MSHNLIVRTYLPSEKPPTYKDPVVEPETTAAASNGSQCKASAQQRKVEMPIGWHRLTPAPLLTALLMGMVGVTTLLPTNTWRQLDSAFPNLTPLTMQIRQLRVIVFYWRANYMENRDAAIEARAEGLLAYQDAQAEYRHCLSQPTPERSVPCQAPSPPPLIW
ncbi:MAG: hypothetical protein NW237_13900 [Cyanobacteriota bacterium]|nr:hypothetical protein [Cyanobacteriota bacterium]